MCGINGFFKLEGARQFDEQAALHRMNAALSHRGPDDHGTWMSADRKVGLGHRRLSILDLSPNGRQPMEGPEGCVVAFNGEIYNFGELKHTFPADSFHSTTDTEVLLRCFEREGKDSLAQLNGMFALAIWDPRKRQLLLARDRAGIKPLYYTIQGGVFAFASEIRALLTLPWVSAKLDEVALVDFLTHNQNAAPRTMFEGIRKLAPGERIVLSEAGMGRPSPFWDLAYRNMDQLEEEEAKDRVFETFRSSVSSQMVSDVPVGAFLSGGVDSSYLVAMMSQSSHAPVRTFSIGFEGAASYDETRFARRVSHLFKTDHFERIVRPNEMADFLPRVAEIFDEPLADPTAIPIYFISGLAKVNGTPVVLTGDGADECFFGYRRWAKYISLLRWFNYYTALPKWTRKLVATGYAWHRTSGAWYETLQRASNDNKLVWGVAGFKESVKRRCLSRRLIDRMEGDSAERLAERYRADFSRLNLNGRVASEVDWLCYQGFRSAVPDKYCYRADHLGMAHSIELRVPFLDNSMIDLSLSLPARLKLRKGIPKYVLKRSAERVLPREILYRKKMGFCVPLKEWGGEIMTGYVRENLKQFCRETGYFSEDGLGDVLAETAGGNPDHVFALWNIFFLMQWFRKWLL